jgi:hypothetical protein
MRASTGGYCHQAWAAHLTRFEASQRQGQSGQPGQLSFTQSLWIWTKVDIRDGDKFISCVALAYV